MSLCVSRIIDIVDASRSERELWRFLYFSRAFFRFENQLKEKHRPFWMIVLSCLFPLEKHMFHTTHLSQDHNVTMERIHTNMG